MKTGLNEKIRKYVEKNYNEKYFDRIYNDLIEVAAGNKPGNEFENELLKRLSRQ